MFQILRVNHHDDPGFYLNLGIANRTSTTLRPFRYNHIQDALGVKVVLAPEIIIAYQTLEVALEAGYRACDDALTQPDPGNHSLIACLARIEEAVTAAIAIGSDAIGNDAMAESKTLSRLQAIQTEIQKQLRLTQMDRLFLQAAQRKPTQQQRFRQLQARFKLMTQYCQGVRALTEPNSAEHDHGGDHDAD